MSLPPETRQDTKHVRLRPARPTDAAFVLSLRTDPSRNAFVSKVDDDPEAQRRWLEDYVARETAGVEYYFIVESLDGEDLGTVRIYNVGKDDFEWGSWIMKPGAPPQASVEAALGIYEFGFGTLGKASCRFEVFRANERVVEFKRRFGAEVTGDDGSMVRFRLGAEDYRKNGRRRFARFLL